jgi:hypothetical protein
VRGNSTRQFVSWEGTEDRAAVAGKPVRLRFHLTRGKLYAFGITLRYIIGEYVAPYHAERPHPATDNLPPLLARPPDPVECLGPKNVVVRERLGGLLRHYERKTA